MIWNSYTITASIILAVTLITLDKGRFVRDVLILAILLVCSAWAVLVYGVASPVVVTLHVLAGPFLRAIGKMDKNANIGETMSKVVCRLTPTKVQELQ